MIYQKASPYFQSAKKYKVLQKIHNETNTSNTDRASSNLKEINEDYVGWVKIQDTNIDYPVVKTTNNDFYLTHDFYRRKDRAGAIFMDYTNSVEALDKNSIVYGHNMRDSSMFGILKNLKNQQYLDQHGIISFQFRGSTYEWEIFSVYVAEDTKWMRTNFSTTNEFEEYISAVKNRSLIQSQTQVTNDDTLLTLSTCTNRDEDERIIVHAKLINKGKDLENEG